MLPEKQEDKDIKNPKGASILIEEFYLIANDAM